MERDTPLVRNVPVCRPRKEPLSLGVTPAYSGTYLGILPKDPRAELQNYLRRCSKVHIEINESSVRIFGTEIPEVILFIEPMANRGSTIEEFRDIVENGDYIAEHRLNPYVSLLAETPDTLGVSILTDSAGQSRIPFITIPACFEIFNAVATVERDLDPAI